MRTLRINATAPAGWDTQSLDHGIPNPTALEGRFRLRTVRAGPRVPADLLRTGCFPALRAPDRHGVRHDHTAAGPQTAVAVEHVNFTAKVEYVIAVHNRYELAVPEPRPCKLSPRLTQWWVSREAAG
jgi:hypothetical protein